ncbi:hypothetical protein BKA81DRAFT_350227 [Phyllosticta paracitricarpa]
MRSRTKGPRRMLSSLLSSLWRRLCRSTRRRRLAKCHRWRPPCRQLESQSWRLRPRPWGSRSPWLFLQAFLLCASAFSSLLLFLLRDARNPSSFLMAISSTNTRNARLQSQTGPRKVVPGVFSTAASAKPPKSLALSDPPIIASPRLVSVRSSCARLRVKGMLVVVVVGKMEVLLTLTRQRDEQ